jgi:hypothetical protein
MDSRALFKYIVYDLRTCFSQQPGHMKRCPVCGKSIMVTGIHPSKAVASDLSHGSLIPVHDFSCLYGCSACHWWAVRESWGFRESSSDLDFLVVGEMDSARSTEQHSTPWHQISQLEDLYNRVEPLPDHLGQLFVGGQRKR